MMSTSNMTNYTDLNSWLRNNYFRFWKTNVRHIGILLPVSMLFCIRLPNFVQIRVATVEIWRHIHFFQNGGRGHSILIMLSYLSISLPSKGQNLPENQISSTYLNSRLKYNYFRFQKSKRPLYWNSTFGFDTDHFAVSCIRLPNFIQIRAPTAEIWRHIHFSRLRLPTLNISFAFLFVDFTAFRRSKFILEFYFRFWSRPFRHNRRVVLHPAAGFRPNRNIHYRNMTSYRYSRWRPLVSLGARLQSR